MNTVFGDIQFSVVDVETTGLFPQRNDRIIEIAIIRITGGGEVLDSFATLVNPMRDIGRSDIHGVGSADVRRAPLFEEIAGDILQRLAGTVFCAHNAHFDKGFLTSEFERVGLALPDFPFLCTMRLSHRIIGVRAGRSLSEACRFFGIDLAKAHSAENDALATSKLLGVFLNELRTSGALSYDDVGIRGDLLPRDAWPFLPTSGHTWTREDAKLHVANKRSWLAETIERMPATSQNECGANEYLSLVDRVLEDRVVSVQEAEALSDLSETLGLSRTQVIGLHEKYLADLVAVAASDGTITESERRDLETVQCLLGLTTDCLDDLLRAGSKRSLPVQGEATESDLAGKTVCFTGSSCCTLGSMPISRSLAERMARDHGLIPVKTLTKKVDVLVVADAETMSGKAVKAKKYGTRILYERVFWQMLGVDIG